MYVSVCLLLTLHVCTCMHYWCKAEIVLQHMQMLYRGEYVSLHITGSSGWKLLFNTTVIMSRSLTTHLSRPSKVLPSARLSACLSAFFAWFPRANTELCYSVGNWIIIGHTNWANTRLTHTHSLSFCCPLLTEQTGSYTTAIPALFPHLFLSLMKAGHE